MKPNKPLTVKQYQAASGITFILVLVAIAFLVGSRQVGAGIALFVGFVAGIACTTWGKLAHDLKAAEERAEKAQRDIERVTNISFQPIDPDKTGQQLRQEFEQMSAVVTEQLKRRGLH